MAEQKQIVVAPVEHKAGRKGFLPFSTNAFDRGSIAVYFFIGFSLLWLRFVEPLGLSVWWAVVISIVVGFFVVKYG
jgi:predicted small integral membrane protein